MKSSRNIAVSIVVVIAIDVEADAVGPIGQNDFATKNS